MKKIKICTFAILLMMTMAVLTACSTKDSGTNETMNPSTSQSTSGTNQGTMNESGSDTAGNGSTGTKESSASKGSGQTNRDGADEESSTGVIGGMIDDVEDGVDDMLNGSDSSSKSNENK